MADTPKPAPHYYEARRANGGWFGVVYHYPNQGDTALIDHQTATFHTQGEAVDAVTDWLDENGIDAELA